MHVILQEKKRSRPVSAYIAFSVYMRKEMQTNKSILADKKFEELSREIGTMVHTDTYSYTYLLLG